MRELSFALFDALLTGVQIMSGLVNFFVGVRSCNLVNKTEPLPKFCVIFLNISLSRDIMLKISCCATLFLRFVYAEQFYFPPF